MTLPAPLDAAVTLLTGPGRGALAVVGICGTDAAVTVDRLFTARSGRPVADRTVGSVAVGRWRPDRGTAGEELVVVRRRTDVLEVHCHGGLAASHAVIEGLVGLGATRLPWKPWLERTGGPEIEWEARQALADAGGPWAARILCRQLAGALATEFERIAALAAAGDEPGVAAATDRLERAARVGLRLVRPWRIVVGGRVNAGKSSLVNAIAGHARSLVSPRAGTTRDLVETRVVLGGWEIDLVDTAGLRPPTSDTERAGITRAIAARADADLVLDAVAADDEAGLAALAAGAAGHSPPPLVVLTKSDLAVGPPLPDMVATSVVTGSGIDTLAARIVDRLVPEVRSEPDLLSGPVPFTPRQLARLDEFRTAARRTVAD